MSSKRWAISDKDAARKLASNGGILPGVAVKRVTVLDEGEVGVLARDLVDALRHGHPAAIGRLLQAADAATPPKPPTAEEWEEAARTAWGIAHGSEGDGMDCRAIERLMGDLLARSAAAKGGE